MNSVTFKPGTKLKDVIKVVILNELTVNNWHRERTAKKLGIGVRTLQRRMHDYGVMHPKECSCESCRDMNAKRKRNIKRTKSGRYW